MMIFYLYILSLKKMVTLKTYKGLWGQLPNDDILTVRFITQKNGEPKTRSKTCDKSPELS